MPKNKFNTELHLRFAKFEDIPILVRHHCLMFEEILTLKGMNIDISTFKKIETAHNDKLVKQLSDGSCVAWLIDKWVKVQRYQEKDWTEILSLWQYFNSHLAWIIQTVSPDVLNHIWRLDHNTQVSLRELMIDYLKHLRVHVDQMKAIINPTK